MMMLLSTLSLRKCHLIVCQDTSSPHALEHTSFAPFLKALAHGAWRSQTARERVPFAAGAEGV
jgi:hypothetical protein